jgi:RNAse (barnase) inhibitor barstar
MTSWLDMRKEIPGLRGQTIHATESETESLFDVLSRLEFKIYIIDGSKIVDEKSFFAEVAHVFAFPSYFGHGWASWDDCLGDFGSLAPLRTAIIWKHADHTFIADAQTFLQAVCDLNGLAIHLALYPTQDPTAGIEAKQLELFFTR